MRVRDLERPANVVLSITPRGEILFEAADQRIRAAFERGRGEGLLHLGASEATAVLDPGPAWLRELGRLFMTRLCSVPDLEELRDRASVPMPRKEIEELLQGVPPIDGAEYLTSSVVEEMWQEMHQAYAREIRAFDGAVQAWLTSKNPVWNIVGKICFHLAENKNDRAHPFAFLATYAARLSRQAKVQHVPLSDALDQYSDDRNALVSLLVPVHRASEQSPLVKELLDSRDLFHPLAWTPSEAYRFLSDIPSIEAAGVVVRVPDWWKPRRPPRLTVGVSIGSREPSKLGVDGLLDFSAALAIDGEPIPEAEWRKLLEGSQRLALIKGKWVEVDPEKLREVLDHWKTVERAAGRDGVSFIEGMRLLAGNGPMEVGAAPAETPEWSRVSAGDWLSKTLQGLRSPESLAAFDPGTELKTQLRPYQRDGVKWLGFVTSLRLGACLADDMGLGKTVQMLALMLILKRERGRGPHLLIVPASLVANWQAEIGRFAPSLRVHVAQRGPSASDGDLVITTYGMLLRLPWLQKVRWDLVILDEAQAIKNPSAKQTRTVKALQARCRVALTGTPVENRLSDLWSLFDFLNPGLLGSLREFSGAMKGRGDYTPLRNLIRPYILRRLKTDKRIIDDLPDKTEVKAYCGLTKEQAAHYQRAVDELEARLESLDQGIRRRGIVLSFLLRFKQICNHPSQATGDGEYRPGASGKFLRLREIVETIAAKQEKALIFTQFREMTGPLADFLAQVFGRSGVVLHGETPVKERMALVERFQKDDRVPFFVLSVRAGGTGLNLTAASHVIHFDRWWNPAVENQATDRAFRIGQKKNVLVHKFICRGTVEEKVDALIESKVGLSKDLLEGGAESLLTEMGDAELLRTVSLDLARATENI